MIPKSTYLKKYQAAHDRFLRPAIINFFEREFGGFFGPVVRENITDALLELFESLCPESTRLKPGQLVWNALDKKTRADWSNRRYVPVILSLVTDEDISLFENGASVPSIRKNVMARMFREAYQQGAVLSTRDMSLLLVTDGGYLSQLRIAYEKEHRTILPHTGVLHDMGTTITHKQLIVHKHIVEKKDPAVIARETNHSQLAVDKYIKDYYRVKTLVKDNKNVEFIHHTTNIAKHVINQYMKIINKDVKKL